jgi:hypothetical protein
MKKIVVDSSTIISCATNCLMWVFDELKKKDIQFIIPSSVKKEVIDSGLESERYKYESIRVFRHIIRGTLTVDKSDIKRETSQILSYANSSFLIRGNPLKILQEADAEVAALAKKLNADAIATDERTLRMLIDALQEILQNKFHAKVEINKNSIAGIRNVMAGIKVLRSVDILSVAFIQGIFDETINYCKGLGSNSRHQVIEGVLFALKFSGCAISFDEVKDYSNLLTGGKL